MENRNDMICLMTKAASVILVNNDLRNSHLKIIFYKRGRRDSCSCKKLKSGSLVPFKYRLLVYLTSGNVELNALVFTVIAAVKLNRVTKVVEGQSSTYIGSLSALVFAVVFGVIFVSDLITIFEHSTGGSNTRSNRRQKSARIRKK